MAVTASPLGPGVPTAPFAPGTPPGPSTGSQGGILGLTDWQAYLIGYGVFMLLAETSIGGLAVIMAWGIALTEILSVAASGESPLTQLGNSIPNSTGGSA